MTGMENEEMLSVEKSVSRSGRVVLRPGRPWTAGVHRLLRHLERSAFGMAPRVIGTGFDADGRDMVEYMEGEQVHPAPWSDDGIAAVGRMLRALHDAAASFAPDGGAVWQRWFLRDIGESGRQIISHGDVAPWNIVTRDGLPVGLIDWEFAGPVDPLAELARVCWLFPQLHDDDVAERVGLPPLDVRAGQLRLLVDAYGLTAAKRHTLYDLIVEVAVREAAEEGIELQVKQDTEGKLWGIAWRTRAAGWMLRNRSALVNALK